jgi:cytochrome c oxidase subunit IV
MTENKDQDIHRLRQTHDVHQQHVEIHHHASSTKTIWKTFWILLIVTMVEVGIAFTNIPRTILVYSFIGLTLVKGYYIVFYFMHLKHEKVNLMWSIMLPFILIVYLIFIALYEGNYLGLLDK